MLRRKQFTVSLNLPFGLGGLEQTWEPDDDERRAAWELYVELATRIATVPLDRDKGLAREALTSLYTLFDSTRAILRRYGPGIAQPKIDGGASFGTLAVTVLNSAIRPLLSISAISGAETMTRSVGLPDAMASRSCPVGPTVRLNFSPLCRE